MTFDDETVLAAIQRLRRTSLVRGIQRIDSRVTKYEHMAADTLNLTSNEIALLCLLMLRGPSTIGVLRTRGERLAEFQSVAEVEAALNALMERDVDPLVVKLPRKAGQKEVRYAHLLSGSIPVDSNDAPGTTVPVTHQPLDERMAVLEQVTAELRSEVVDLRRQLEEFRKQFE